MNQLLLILAGITETINEAMPTLIERLPASQVQKFRDLVQSAETAAVQHVTDVTLEGEEFNLPMPKEIAEVLTAFNAELTRRAKFDQAQAAQTERIAVALELIAERLQLPNVVASL